MRDQDRSRTERRAIDVVCIYVLDQQNKYTVQIERDT